LNTRTLQDRSLRSCLSVLMPDYAANLRSGFLGPPPPSLFGWVLG
jgi:hypothetical protein